MSAIESLNWQSYAVPEQVQAPRFSSPLIPEGIVGESSAIQRVFDDVRIVAPTDANVLIQGETGCGKELIARAIHTYSDRRNHKFVKVNCAAIPCDLLESEMFGHEKGAFTGAITHKIGRFELADKGTLFLDEVADMPLELQPKLLRVLQELEFEKLGSIRTQQVNVRVVAATNRDLNELLGTGKFREDLYYRLNVFPIVIPPLRERREDIPKLADHFAQRMAERMRKHVESIPSDVMEVLESYDWPGNARELQNFIERSVILAKGPVLRPPLNELRPRRVLSKPSARFETLQEIEREHILQALRASKWVIGGLRGAAARLGLKRTTLAYRIKKLGISCRPV
jgi:formate hydrogenlyase transcriptional activator